MLSVLLLSFTVVNFTADLGGSTVEYPHSQRVFIQTHWNQTFNSSGSALELRNNFNVTLLLSYNTTSEYTLTFESYELDSYVYSYDSNFDIVYTFHYDNYLNQSITTTNLSSIGNFGLAPYSYDGHLYYGLGYVVNDNVTQLGSYSIPTIPSNLVPYMNPVSFNSADFVNEMYFVMQTVTVSQTYQSGFNDGYAAGYEDGAITGQQIGYADGYSEGASQDATAVAIFSGIISIALIPINFFLACLNFEVFGINIGAFVSALLTVAIVVIITRIIVSGGNGGDK